MLSSFSGLCTCAQINQWMIRGLWLTTRRDNLIYALLCTA